MTETSRSCMFSTFFLVLIPLKSKTKDLKKWVSRARACVSASHAHSSQHPAPPLPPLLHHHCCGAAASTLGPRNTLSCQGSCQGGRGMDPAHVPTTNKGGRRVLLRDLEEERKEEQKRGGTDARFKVQSEGSDLSKGRVRHLEKRDCAGQGGNCSCPKMIHWGKFSFDISFFLSRLLQPLQLTLSRLSAHYSLSCGDGWCRQSAS